MIMDQSLEFCDALDISASTGTALVGDVIDLDQAGSLGAEMLHLVIQVTASFTTGTTAAVQFILASDAQPAIAADGTETRHALTDAYDTGELTAGKVIIIAMPRGNLPAYERYLGVEAITSGAATTAGSINAFLTRDVSAWQSLPDAVN